MKRRVRVQVRPVENYAWVLGLAMLAITMLFLFQGRISGAIEPLIQGTLLGMALVAAMAYVYLCLHQQPR